MYSPNVKKELCLDTTIYDIVPTILFILDLPISSDLDGRILFEAFEREFRKKKIQTYRESRLRSLIRAREAKLKMIM